MPVMKKSKVLERLKAIERKHNEDAQVIRDLIGEVHKIDGELDTKSSPALRDKLYCAENDAGNLSGAFNSLETTMYSAEDRCYECGYQVESNEASSDNKNLHTKCVK